MKSNFLGVFNKEKNYYAWEKNKKYETPYANEKEDNMSNFLCIVSTESLDDKSIYGATLKKIIPVESISNELGFETGYYYSIVTSINYEKIAEARTVCPENYYETEKLYNSIYGLIGEILNDKGKVALFLSFTGQKSFETIWDKKLIQREALKTENLQCFSKNIKFSENSNISRMRMRVYVEICPAEKSTFFNAIDNIGFF